MLKKIGHLFLALLLVVFAVLQWNDPDPFLWILMYLITACLPILALFDKLQKWVPEFLAVVLFLLFAFSVPDIMAWIKDGCPSIYDEMKAETPYVESVREALGIMICLIVAFGYLFSRRKQSIPQ